MITIDHPSTRSSRASSHAGACRGLVSSFIHPAIFLCWSSLLIRADSGLRYLIPWRLEPFLACTCKATAVLTCAAPRCGPQYREKCRLLSTYSKRVHYNDSEAAGNVRE
ncbi:hypothetical protein BOTBODRAFT_218132 [Botryobasidium botryosum FD-172 SS1]|uniref:Uncharacterized protein n=1 Tax=Botryobasidium botryosum (strain FD-172 SS1) TaxID=930990 RepID=A0A067MMW8_BOTB1|nr:hypothetical protein BOTBODRAFT_218132 [Botryobasidium botryosum FD-172 SS1]